MEIEVPYGSERLGFEVNKQRLLGVIAPVQTIPSPDPSKEIEISIENPINALKIENVVHKGKKVSIVCDDTPELHQFI